MNNDRCPIIALVGRPNVGKSSFFNRLIRKRKAIVDPTPGVTRDRHYEHVTWDNHQFILVDTGGIETGRKESMQDGIQVQTWQAVQEADLILFMMDGREGLLTEDYEVISLLRKTQKPLYFVINKIDGPEHEEEKLAHFYELGNARLWPISASHGYGVAELMDDLVVHLTLPDAVAEELPADTIRLACIGRPNVGKSSLINRLLGEERMLVSEIAGTTRDAIDTLLEKGGKHYLLVDTAGIRAKGKTTEKLEKFSIIQALSAMERCDVVLVLLDSVEGITEQDTKIIGYALERGRACLVLLNKWDLVLDDKKRQKMLLEGVEQATTFIGFAPTMSISALTGFGIKRILPTVNTVYEQYCRKFTTNKLNRILQAAVDEHHPGLHLGRKIKFYYITQLSSRPPTFVIFVNYPKGVHFSYSRYLVNQFREGLGLDHSPVRLVFRERSRKDPESFMNSSAPTARNSGR